MTHPPDSKIPPIVHAPHADAEPFTIADLYEAGIAHRPIDDPWNFFGREQHQALKDWAEKQPKPKTPRKPSLETVLKQARKADARSVIIDGVTYTLGQAEQQSTDTDREHAEFEARHET